MTYNEFKEAVNRYAGEAGLTEYDLYYQRSASTTVKAYHGAVDDFSDKTAVGACFRCIADGKTGYSHTQLLSDEEARRVVRDAAACAEVLESIGFAAIFDGKDVAYQALPQSAREGCDVEKLKEAALAVERLTKAKDERIVSVPYAYARYSYGETGLSNSRGLDLVNAQSGYTVLCEAVAEADGRKYAGSGGQEKASLEEISLDELVREAVELAVGGIGGTTVPSGEYPVVFSRRMMCEMLSAFSPVFSADSAQKGLSLLGGKEGGEIAAGIVTLVDDPLRPDSLHKTHFDDEGVPTATKTLVEAGVLKTLLYDMKSAAKAGRASTGNGRKASYAGDINVAPYNLCLQAGNISLESLLSGVKHGLYITELKGLHSSANASTGDFSLESKGFLIENGKLSRPCEQFTVAGNFYTLLRDIEMIADNFLLEDGFGSAAVLVSKLSVAG